MPSENTIGQPPAPMLDNCAAAHNDTQAESDGHQYIGGSEPASVATVPAQPEQWASIPQGLRERPQWCLAAPDKTPRRPDGSLASSTNPATWTDFDTACAAARQRGWHVGYMLHEADTFTCIDLDIKPDSPPDFLQHCTDTITTFDSYTEHSRSGAGYHIWVEGDVGAGRRGGGVEVYSKERFIICTGHMVNPKPIENRDHLVKQYANMIGGKEAEFEALPDAPAVESDESILQRAFRAENGSKISAHYNGDWAEIGHNDHSKADESLLQMLAHYTPNNEQLTRLFLASALGQREKAKRKDYLPRTIAYVRTMQASDSSRNAQRVEHGQLMAAALLENFERQQDEQRARNKARAESRIKVFSAAELVKRPPVRWRISGILPEEGFAALYGPPACGKSFLTLDMLAHIASGQHWFGHRVRQSPVAYVAFEGAHGVPQRVMAFQREYWALDRISFIEAPTISLMEPADREALIDVLRQHLLTSGVLCIDTLAASAPGIDENSSEGMGKLISELQAIQYEVGGCILVVHHTGKDRDRGLRGWSGLNGALDAAIEVTKAGSGSRSWKLTKAKDGQDGLGSSFDLKPVFLMHDEYGEPITSCVIAPAEECAEVDHAALDDADDEFVWDWVRKKVEAGDFPSKNSLKGQLSDMKRHIEITQPRLFNAVERLMAASRLVKAAQKSPSGNVWIRAVDRPGSLA